ncbi:LysR family transcriptional regulator [Goodfellowiella coeruleoviolacea]|uniref:DNA-binding transcriptional regulator, LysR family n=1 Tax=Goodfellowiella coeruleoviolacea TaxID=334858 RepID=A0AAE3GAA4_9PSEU|nr:LysR family transcriptional regulator [Goodfellowiella coeruleoviolacea]MCP2163770.1 DNA-binding transcriptional regulator, LysR family [Goodfellowiella coeruleoviolacea]
MTLSQLRALLAVVEHGGFTVAAERIGMSQPAVSRAVSALERELGAALFVRHRDGVALTEAGRLAAARAREALRQFDLIAADVAAATGRVTGTLRLVSLPTATGPLVAPRLRAFTDRFPQVQVRLFEGFDRDVRDWLGQGAAEVGVVTLPAPGLHTFPLASDEMLALVPAGHRLARRATVPFAELAGEPFILSTGGCRPVILAAAREAGIQLDVTFEAGELSAIREMVTAGLGVSVVPSLGLPDDLGPVVARPLVPRTTRELALAVRSPADCAPAARAFLDMSAARAHDQRKR